MMTSRRGLAALVAVGMLLAGCGGDDASSVDDVEGEFAQEDGGGEAVDPGAEEPAATEAQGEGRGEGEGDEGTGGTGDATEPEAATNRQLIYRASVGLSSDDPDQTVERVEAAAREAGGFVSTTQLRRDDLDLLRGSITIRVPAGNLDQLLADVSDAAEVTSRDQSVEDVTGQVADLESRLRNLRALEEELLVLLTEAREGGDTDDVLAVFDRVGQVREEIEVLEGRRADLGDQVELSTLTVQVDPSPALVESRSSEPDDDLPLPWSPGNVVSSAWDATVAALQSFVDTAIRVVVFMVPVVLVWLSPVWLAVLAYVWWRRRRDRDAGTSGTTSAPHGDRSPNDPDADVVDSPETPDDTPSDQPADPPAAPQVGAGSGRR